MNECRNSTIQLGWVLLRREISRFGFCEEGDRKRQCICLWEWCDCDLPEVLRCGAGTHCLISRSKARDFQRWSHHLASRVLADAARLMQHVHLASQRASGFSEVYSHACQSFMHSDAWGRGPSTSDRGGKANSRGSHPRCCHQGQLWCTHPRSGFQQVLLGRIQITQP